MLDPCPRCLHLRRTLPEQTPGWCRVCHRWQYIYQAELAQFVAAVHRHLACVQCHRGAWCRDLQRRDGAEECARQGHVEDFELHAVKG